MAAYDDIKKAIIDGQFDPGQRLTEEYLAETFKFSRTPIREALRNLRADGLVVADGRGVSVSTFTEAEISEIYDLRSLLEGYAAGFAAMHSTPVDIVQLDALNQEMDDIIHEPYEQFDADRVERIMSSNQRLHEAIMDLSGKQMLHAVVSKMMVLPLIFRSYYWRSPTDIVKSHDDHKQIVLAIAEHDVRRAETAMAEHIFTGRDQVLHNLSRSSKTSQPNDYSE